MRLVADRLSVRWYLGYNLDEPLPDHSSLTRIRARYGLEVFRRFFDVMVERPRQAGLVWGEDLYFDPAEVQANAAFSSLTPRFAIEARKGRQAQQAKKTAEAHLAVLFADISDEAAPSTPPPPPPQPAQPQHPENLLPETPEPPLTPQLPAPSRRSSARNSPPPTLSDTIG